MSRRLTLASVLLLIVGVWGVFEGFTALFYPEFFLSTRMNEMNENLIHPDLSSINEYSPNLMDFMVFNNRAFGLYAMVGSLFLCVVSLVPYRNGEKWAWYVMLIIGGINIFGTLTLNYIGVTSQAPITIIMAALWIIGITIPAKEIQM